MSCQSRALLTCQRAVPQKIRRFMLFSPPCWFTCHLPADGTPNVGGVLNEIFVLASILVAMFRYDFKKTGKTED